MSGADRVQSFNPILALMWGFQLIVLYIDWSGDGRVSWSIPVIGSFFFIQLYMIWRTNYEKMEEERRTNLSRALGGPQDVPDINPQKKDLADYYKTEQPNKQISGPLLNVKPEETESENSSE